MEPIIKLKDISVSYQNIFALSDVNLEVYQGEYIGIFGPNGSGKTTLLKTILGLKEPDNGIVELFGSENLKNHRKKIGYVPQNPMAAKTFPASVQKVVEMGLYGKIGFLKPLKEEDHQKAERALHKVHMGDYKNRPIGHLSGGELQKVMVARALVSDPKVVLLDEPTSSLDFVMTRELMELMEELNHKYNITIMVIHHHIDLLLPYCSRLLLINRSIIYDGEPESEDVHKRIREIFNLPQEIEV
ncbi:MAG: metal ABC transporter ATP-binding protein [Promethearchaeia archaeon]